MKNMGFTQLRIVKGCDRFDPEALKFAVAAKDLLETAQIFPDLASAMADCTLTVGTTRRHGKYRQEILSPAEVAGLLKEQVTPDCRAAIVFGREDNGLTTEELSLCRSARKKKHGQRLWLLPATKQTRAQSHRLRSAKRKRRGIW